MLQAQSGSGGSDVVDLTLEADGDAEAGELAAAAGAAAAADARGAGTDAEDAAAPECGEDASDVLVECSTATHGMRLHKRALEPLAAKHALKSSTQALHISVNGLRYPDTENLCVCLQRRLADARSLREAVGLELSDHAPMALSMDFDGQRLSSQSSWQNVVFPVDMLNLH